MDEALTAAVRELLAEVGYVGLTVAAVAERAKVGKAAIYRRYTSKAELVFAAAVRGADPEPPPDTGSLTGDLNAVLKDVRDSVASPVAAAAIPGLLSDVANDRRLAKRLHASFVLRQRVCLRVVLDRAVERGELREVPDVDLVHSFVLGPVFARRFLLEQGMSPAALRLHAKLIAAALTAEG